MYCPKCLNDTLKLSTRGTVHVEINKKKMDSRKFIYNLDKEPHTVIMGNLKKKMDDFFKWYSSFQNREPIKHVNIYSTDFQCSAGCKLQFNQQTSVIDVMFTTDEVKNLLSELSKKHEISIEWEAKAAS